MVVTMKDAVFRDVTPCGLVDVYHSFGEICCDHLQGKRLRVTALFYPEDGSSTLLQGEVNIYQNTRGQSHHESQYF
jgi:hypothetical protein